MLSRVRLLARLACLAALAAILSLPVRAQEGNGWAELYASRLESSASYREAKLAVRTAQVALDQYAKPYLPVISLSTLATSPFKLTESGFAGGSLVPTLGLEHLLGADLALALPLKLSGAGALSLEDPSIRISRKLFTEEEAARLDAEAALLNARASMKNAEDSLRLALAREILNAKYYASLLEANRKNIEVLDRVRKATVSPVALRELDRRILAARKSLLVATKALDDVSAEVQGDLERLFSDLMGLQGEWAKGAEALQPETSLGIKALELGLEAAERRKAFSILPYLPNPSLGAELSYDTGDKSLDWSLSFSLSYDIADKGRISLDALRRREYPDIYRARLSDARKSLVDGVKTIRLSIESLELDLKIQRLDIEDAQDELATMEALFRGDFISEENLVIAEIDLSVERLDAEKIEYDILVQRLSLAKYFQAEL